MGEYTVLDFVEAYRVAVAKYTAASDRLEEFASAKRAAETALSKAEQELVEHFSDMATTNGKTTVIIHEGVLYRIHPSLQARIESFPV